MSSYWMIDGKKYTEEEHNELLKQQEHARQAELQAEEQARIQGERLIGELAGAYAAYKRFLEQHPQLFQWVTEGNAPFQDIYEDLRENLGRADQAPRCSHIKADGRNCGSPRMNGHSLCYAHTRMAAARPQALRLPPLEDSNSIQLGLMEVARALIDGQIGERAAGLLFYGLQIAASNVGRTTFEEMPDEIDSEDLESEENETTALAIC